jgi:hypothetical protein
MPKQSKSQLTKLRQYVREFGDVFTVNTDVISKTHVLYCQSCAAKVNCDQKTQVKQHINTQNHRNSLKNFKSRQLTVQEIIDQNKTLNQKEFNTDLCRFLVSMNIPFYKILNQEFKSFIEKYTQFKTPDDSTLRKSYLKDLYDSIIQHIRHELIDQYIWIAVDETTDCMGRYVANVIVGSLNSEVGNNTKFLLNMEFLPKTNNFTIVQSINNALMILWPEGIKYDKVLLLLTSSMGPLI